MQQLQATCRLLAGEADADQSQRYYRFAFSVAQPAEKLTLTADYALLPADEKAQTPFFLFDPNHHVRFMRAANMASAGDVQTLVLSQEEASKGGIPGAIPAGEWLLIIFKRRMRVSFDLRITVTISGEAGSQQEADAVRALRESPFSAKQGEPLVRRAAGGLAPRQRRADVAVDVRHHQVDALLVERVEAPALEHDAADVLVVALDVRLVRRRVRARVEHLRPPRSVVRGGLDREGVGELGAVVLEHGREEEPEGVRPERRVQPVEGVGDVLGALAGHGPGGHEARHREHGRQQDAPVAPAAHDGVGLRDLHARVRGDEGEVALPCAALRAAAVHLVLDGTAPALLVAHGHREVVPLDGKDPAVDVVVQRALAHREGLGGRGHRVVGALAPVERRHEDLVDGPKLALGQVDALPRLRQGPAVALVRNLVQVVELAQAAAPLVGAAVADAGRGGEARAALLLEARARALAAPDAAARAAPRAARPPAQARRAAFVAADARVEPAPVERLGGLHAAVHCLPPDGRAGYSRLAADLSERLALAQRGFQRKAQVVRQVLVPLFPDCHVGILSLLRRGGIAAPARRMPFPARRGKWALPFARLSGQVFPSPPPTYFFNRHSSKM